MPSLSEIQRSTARCCSLTPRSLTRTRPLPRSTTSRWTRPRKVRRGILRLPASAARSLQGEDQDQISSQTRRRAVHRVTESTGWTDWPLTSGSWGGILGLGSRLPCCSASLPDGAHRLQSRQRILYSFSTPFFFTLSAHLSSSPLALLFSPSPSHLGRSLSRWSQHKTSKAELGGGGLLMPGASLPRSPLAQWMPLTAPARPGY